MEKKFIVIKKDQQSDREKQDQSKAFQEGKKNSTSQRIEAFLNGLNSQKVKIKLVDGTELKGTLFTGAVYDVKLLEEETNSFYVIHKHQIVYAKKV